MQSSYNCPRKHDKSTLLIFLSYDYWNVPIETIDVDGLYAVLNVNMEEHSGSDIFSGERIAHMKNWVSEVEQMYMYSHVLDATDSCNKLLLW